MTEKTLREILYPEFSLKRGCIAFVAGGVIFGGLGLAGLQAIVFKEVTPDIAMMHALASMIVVGFGAALGLVVHLSDWKTERMWEMRQEAIQLMRDLQKAEQSPFAHAPKKNDDN